MAQKLNGHMSFRAYYGPVGPHSGQQLGKTKVMVPIELKISTYRVQYCDELTNDKKLQSNLDALEELKDTISI